MRKLKYMVAVLCIASTASAQDLISGRYNDGYLYRHDLNPANEIILPFLYSVILT